MQSGLEECEASKSVRTESRGREDTFPEGRKRKIKPHNPCFNAQTNWFILNTVVFFSFAFFGLTVARCSSTGVGSALTLNGNLTARMYQSKILVDLQRAETKEACPAAKGRF